MELLKDMGLAPSMMRNNEGCVVLKPAALKAYMARCVCLCFDVALTTAD